MKAGQVIPVKFWTTEITNVKQKVNKNIPQARHGGGLCEFSLSYDGGKTFNVFATYSETCPDAAFDWQRPWYAAACSLGLGLLTWFLSSTTTKKMQIYDFKGKGIKQGVTFKGDGNSKSRGPGPIPSELKANIRPSK
ncbi:hypothetical protein BGW38_003872 [Lunasporangiospora selenospora]|uniref:Uncharacterized protein n=1 Tax=Lunasporangiospora selenospora TaxID=979761 RepID=A0A9P6FQJ9_9FUNG|nr:hypothetical protein BGW38_003872 [Lunasporangiospora selenospora]